MKLNINDIKPLPGKMSCYLWENSHTNLPLSLFYTIEIPLQPFDSGHDYVDQPIETTIMIEWAIFSNGPDQQQELNWRNLTGKSFNLTYDDNTAEGSVYLGTEHCPVNAEIRFLSLTDFTFDIELKMKIDFNIETSNLPADGLVRIATQVEFDGLRIYHTQLPTFKNSANQLDLIGKYVDVNVYHPELSNYENENVDWKHLKPR